MSISVVAPTEAVRKDVLIFRRNECKMPSFALDISTLKKVRAWSNSKGKRTAYEMKQLENVHEHQNKIAERKKKPNEMKRRMHSNSCRSTQFAPALFYMNTELN